ncbi:MAG: biotin/lipoyl-containing protein [Planctomycetota bacterium]
MKYFVQHQDREIEVELRPDGQGFVAEIDGKSYRVDPAAVEEGERYSLLIDGRSADVAVDGSGTRLTLVLGGQAIPLLVENTREHSSRQIASAGRASGEIIVSSQMPGIVRGVLVEAGQQVRAGQPLVILEAMKMENELSAEHDGVVVRVNVEKGETVNGGDPLVVLRPGGAGG